MKFEVGKAYDFGTTILSEDDIINFAKEFDPLIFHVDKAAAEKSHFKGLVASGPQIFTLVHKREWIPLFGETVVAGLGVNNWKFLAPVRPNQKIISTCTILDVTPNSEKKVQAVNWFYEFKDEQGTMLQFLEMLVLHNFS